MSTERGIFERLREPFPAHEIEWRVGSTTKAKDKGMALAYLTARACMDRLDGVVGPENWTDAYRKDGAATICRLGILVKEDGGRWLYHEDASDESDIEAVKGGVSGAFKRACVKFGIGRYLYHLDALWVPIKARGRSVVIDGDPPTLPAWALPGGSGKPDGPGLRPASTQKTSPSRAFALWRDLIEMADAADDRDGLKSLWVDVADAYKREKLEQEDTIELQAMMQTVGKRKGWDNGK